MTFIIKGGIMTEDQFEELKRILEEIRGKIDDIYVAVINKLQ